MNNSGNNGNFEDPLFSRLRDSKTTKSRSRPLARKTTRASSSHNSNRIFITGLLFVVALGLLGYFLYQTQKNIDSLSTELSENHEQLNEVKTDLGESQTQLARVS